jgi:hypothetical protein
MKVLLLLPIFFLSTVFAQEITQTVRGTVTDSESQYPLVGAKIKILNEAGEIKYGAITDDKGNFSISNVAVGKHQMKITSIGYTEQTITVIVNSGKETIVQILLQETSIVKQEVVVTGRQKGEIINEMATVSAQTFSVEETNRYAGSRSDPARMMSNYAGCQGTDDSRNDIVVRGNSPLGIQYRIEGLQIPNPNHFGIAGSSGGPVSILNNKFLDNSDFFMSAFPAEYGNSTAGVFDLRVRKGNDKVHEFSGQFGFLGTEVLLEGPISKKSCASYLILGRYSTLSIMDKLGIAFGTDAVPAYGDGAFKFNFPTKKGGQFSLWGMGGASTIDILISDQEEVDQDAFGQQDRDQYFRTKMFTSGLTYKKPINPKTLFKASIGYSYENQNSHHDYILRHLDTADATKWIYDAAPFNIMGYSFTTHTPSFYTSVNYKANKKHVIKYGINVDSYLSSFSDSIRADITDSSSAYYLRWDYTSSSPDILVQPFVQWKYNPKEKLTLNMGLHAQYFTLGNSVSYAEPRMGIRYDVSEKSNIGFGVGLHSQSHPRYIYYYHLLDTAGNKIYHNRDLGFTRALHTVLSYSTVKKSLQFKVETYYQYLFQVPVEVASSSFSILNQGSGFSRFFPDSLQNTGTGQNYGLELTVQKFFDKDFFFLVTGSLYNSQYKGSDGVMRNTDFNGNYIINALTGKEFKPGQKKRHTFTVGAKVTYAGGKRYGYVDTAASNVLKDLVYLDAGYNERRFDNYFRLDMKLSWSMNARKTTHEIGIDLVNILNTKNILGLTYDPGSAQGYTERLQLGFLPLFYYKLDFKLGGKKE